MTQSSVIETLARALHRKMEHLDPSDGPDWDSMDDFDKDYYITCIEYLVDLHGTELRAALEQK